MTKIDLKALRANAEAFNQKMTDEEWDSDLDPYTCFKCFNQVEVREGYDFDNGDLCDVCAQEYHSHFNPDTILKLIEALELAKDACLLAERYLDSVDGYNNCDRDLSRKSARYGVEKALERIQGIVE